jgi:hypothetical protein
LNLDNTILLRARNNTHPWVFWEKVSRNLVENHNYKLIYVCINRPKAVIKDEFRWNEIDKYIENNQIYFIDGFTNIINNDDKNKKGYFNPYNINSLLLEFEKIIGNKSNTSDYIVVVDSLSFLLKFAGNENTLKFIYYLISLSSNMNFLNLLYYRENIVSKEIEVAIENSVDSILDFHSAEEGFEKLIFTKFRLTKIKKKELKYKL